jgi:hypothetical protein
MLLGPVATALVLAGSAYAVTRGDDGRGVSLAFGPPPTSAGSAEDVTRANRAYAERIAGAALERLRMRAGQLPGGVREVRAGAVPALTRLVTFIGPGVGHDFTRSAFFEAPGDAHAVASWFAAHPPVGASSEADPTAVGGSRNADGSWSDEALFDYPSGDDVSDHASLASQVQITPQGHGVGIRVTVFGSYRSGRPAASFAHDVDTIRVRVTDRVMGRNGGRTRITLHTRTLTPSQIQRVVSQFNALPGGGPFGMSCPVPRATRTYRLAFDTSSGTLTAAFSIPCGGGIWVRRDGRDVPPMVDAAGFVEFLDALLALPQLPSF